MQRFWEELAYQCFLGDKPNRAAVVLCSLQVLVWRAGHNAHSCGLRHKPIGLHAAQQLPQVFCILQNQGGSP